MGDGGLSKAGDTTEQNTTRYTTSAIVPILGLVKVNVQNVVPHFEHSQISSFREKDMIFAGAIPFVI